MKNNILIYSLAAMAGLALASCKGDYDDWASPQSYGAEASASAYGLTAAAGTDANVVMPLSDDDVKLVALSSTSPEVSNYSVKTVLVNGEEIDATVSDGYIVVSGEDLDELIEKQYNSRASVTRNIEVKSVVALNLSNGDAISIADTLTTAATLTPAATPSIDANGYYVLGDFVEGNGKDPATPVWMTKVSDGVYTVTVNTKSTTSNWFKFYEGSHYGSWDEANLGEMGCQVKDDESPSGFIIYTGDKYKVLSPVIAGQGTFEITLNMNDLTYSIVGADAIYYLIGNPNGWSISDNTCMFYGLGNNTYTYTTKYTNQWDLKILEAKYLGTGDTAWNYCWGGVNGSTDATGSLFNTDVGAIGPNVNGGWYTFTFDMNYKTYSWTAIEEPTTEYTSISLIGDFNSWSGDVDMTQLAKSPHNWYGRVEIPSDGGLKFRANHEWTTSWGADVDLSEHYYGTATSDNGPNINVPAGTYDFYFNDITGNFNIVAVE